MPNALEQTNKLAGENIFLITLMVIVTLGVLLYLVIRAIMLVKKRRNRLVASK
jgi:hypothetical protein